MITIKTSTGEVEHISINPMAISRIEISKYDDSDCCMNPIYKWIVRIRHVGESGCCSTSIQSEFYTGEDAYTYRDEINQLFYKQCKNLFHPPSIEME